MTAIDDATRQTAATRARYNRIAPLYDALEWFTEPTAFETWRQQLWTGVSAGRVWRSG